MLLVKWDKGFSVGIKVIDDQHKKLLDVINDLDEAIAAGKGGEIYDALFDEVVDYFTQNFSTEEELMLAHSYPDFESHKTLHLGFTANVKGLRARAFKGDSAVSEEALKFLVEWLIHHDIAVDKKLGAFLLERGIE